VRAPVPKLPHKLEPDRCYRTTEEWAETEHGISRSRCGKLRAGWELGELLDQRGHTAPEGQVRELVRNRHGLNAAIGVYELVADAVGSDKVTAARLRETIALLPGDLTISEDDPAEIARALAGALEGTPPPAPAPGLPPALRRDVERRAVALADRLDRGRIPRNEVLAHLLAAFADEHDTRVFEAVLERMKTGH